MDWPRLCEEWLLGFSLCNRIETLGGARGQILLDKRNKRALSVLTCEYK